MPGQNPDAPICWLTADLFAEIMDVCDPHDFFNLARTCKWLAELTEPVLGRHREAYRRFRHASDLDPACFPALIRSVVLHQDPVVVRYARSIDVWGTRLSWDEWRQYRVDERGVHTEGDVVEVKPFEAREVQQILALTRDLVGETELKDAREELENGADGLLKFLVIASCPRLETLKFIRRNDVLHKSCQVWLEKSIRHITSTGVPWPAGLRGLRDAAFGVDGGILDEHIDVVDGDLRADRDGGHALAAFLRLPAVTSLYYHAEALLGGDKDDEDEDEEEEPDMPTDCSVEHLYLDNVWGASHDFLEALYAAPRKLESFTMRLEGGDWFNDPDSSLEHLAESQASHLKQLMFYNPHYLHGYRCSAYRPEDVQAFQGLKLWYQCIGDVELQACYDAEGSDADRKDVVDAWRKYVLPETEVLVMNGSVGLYQRDNPQAWCWFDEGLEAVIKDSAAAGKPLKALFVMSVDKDGEEQREEAASGVDGGVFRAIPKTVAMAEQRGIDVYTRAKGGDTTRTRHKLEFPQAVTKWDIPSGPDFGKRIEDGYVAFDPLSGHWTKESEASRGFYIEP